MEKELNGVKEIYYTEAEVQKIKEENKKLNNMYTKEYDEHIEMKRQNGVLRNNELILKRKIEELEVENKNREHSHINLYNDFKHYKQYESIPISVIQNKIKELEQIKSTALTFRTVEMMNDKIQILELLLEDW